MTGQTPGGSEGRRTGSSGGRRPVRGEAPRGASRGAGRRQPTSPAPARSGRPALLGPRRSGPAEPRVPDDVTPRDLDRSVRAELRSLSKANADEVARHLVMIGRLLPDDPEAAYAHAMAAQRRAGRVAIVREVVGVAAYHAGRWAEALSELRAARRMSGSSHLLPLMADAERGLGRPERALELAGSAEAASLAVPEQVEMAIVVSGARRDLGQPDAAVLALQIPQLSSSTVQPYTPRLWYAYADALLDAGRRDEAATWFARAADADPDGSTEAGERLAELQGLQFVDLEEDDSGDE
jgi:tetratricopeptide (TPR) repeat protein